MLRLQDMVEPGPDTAEVVRTRLAARSAARAAVLDAETNVKLKEALEKTIQSTDKQPLDPGTAVDYLVIPDGKTGSQYWEPNGTVVSMGVDGTSSKLVVIRRANAIVQEGVLDSNTSPDKIFFLIYGIVSALLFIRLIRAIIKIHLKSETNRKCLIQGSVQTGE